MGNLGQTVAVCLLHSYRNPAHERRVGEILKEELPDLFHSLSVDVLPEIREYERTSTTVVNAYLRPIVETYLSSLIKLLRGAGVASPVHVMQSNGGIMSAQRATETPVQLVESGPAAGTVAAEALGLKTHLSNLITFDMGGTTAKASLIENGSRSWTTEYEIGAGISLVQPPGQGGRPRPQNSGHGSGRGRSRRRQHCLDRQRGRSEGGTEERGCDARPGQLWTRSGGADRHRR